MHDAAYKHTCIDSVHMHSCPRRCCGSARHSIQTHVHQELCLRTAVLSTAATHSLLCSTGSGARAFAAVFLCTTVSTVKARLWFSTAVMHDSRLLWLCSTGSCACAQLSRAWLGLESCCFHSWLAYAALAAARTHIPPRFGDRGACLPVISSCKPTCA